ncbi:MAG: RagB/SusD family nutrient uptake outer membrane protein, partial [Chitinophagaceae bacterium]
MKPTTITCFAVLFMALVSCSKILDTKPTDFSTPDQYYSTESQLNDALAGVYTGLSNKYLYNGSYLFILNTGNDESWYRSTTIAGPPVYTHDASNVDISGLWANLYDGINTANALLENINKPEMDSTARKVIKGEALFLRAYYYFLLVQHWGDVPLKLTSTTSPASNTFNLARTPAKQVYEQIIADMITAEGLVKEITDYGYTGRVTKSAVQGMLARVCLYMAGEPVKDATKYEQAAYWANKVITSGKHSLNPDYKQIFINEMQDKYDIKECIWESEFYGNETSASGGDTRTSGYVGIQVGVQCAILDSGYCYGTVMVHGLLYKSFDATDKRRDWEVAPYTYSGANKVAVASNQYYTRFPGKWRREYETLVPRAKNACGTNFPILRYADVLLMKAEAENEVNGPAAGLPYLNQVRARAGITQYVATDAAVNSKGNFLKTIQTERYKELAFEGLRTTDLMRWGLLITNT